MTITNLDIVEGGPREMFRRLGLGERRGYRALKRGDFPWVRKVGNRYVVPKRALERYLSGDLHTGKSAE